MTFRILDLYSGGGGAAKGYDGNNFEVLGIDIQRQPHYPYAFIQADAIAFLKDLIGGQGLFRVSDFDAIHASPPCQRWSQMSRCRPGLAEKYPDLITPTRFLLRRLGLPYVIENVMGAPLIDPVMLCGSHFGLKVDDWEGHDTFGVQRHRMFETWPFRVPAAGMCDHSIQALPIYGHNPGGCRPNMRGRGFAAAARRAMGIDWMNRDELSEAIPPAFTKYIGKHLMTCLIVREAVV